MSTILGDFGTAVKNHLKSILSGSAKDKQGFADCLIRNLSGDVLLLQRTSLAKIEPNKWCFPGGHIDAGESPIVAALREADEEIHVDLSSFGIRYLKSIEKENCVIHYFEAVVGNVPIILDNNEHYRWEFVPVNRLSRYDMIFDLQTILQDELLPLLAPVDPIELQVQVPNEVFVAEANSIFKSEDIQQAYSEGLIEEKDYTLYQTIQKSISEIFTGYDNGLVSDEQAFGVIEKAKHYEFVKVLRDGKQFYQYREVGTDKIESDVEVGSMMDTSAALGLQIKKYSDKSILITGDTYKNVNLLRQAKEAAGGYGAFNKPLNGWIFPLFAKDKIIALMADKMAIDTYDETKVKEAAINLKNSVDIGTEVTVDGKPAEVTEVTTNDEGKVVYTVETKVPDIDLTSVAATNEAAEKEAAIASENHEKALAIIRKQNEVGEMLKRFGEIVRSGNFNSEEQVEELNNLTLLINTVKTEVWELENGEKPIGTISPDGKFVKTAGGWEYIKETKEVTEEKAAIKPASNEKAAELISKATPESRQKITKEIFGKEEGEKPAEPEPTEHQKLNSKSLL